MAEPIIQVRMATLNDTSSIATILVESFAEYKSLYTPEAFAATTLTSEQIASRLNEGPCWIAVRDREIVGTVSAVPKAEAIYIRSMAVTPKARGGRIGQLLLSCIEDFAAARGCKHLFLSTTPFLIPAIRLYEHCGFRQNKQELDDLFGTPLITMVKDLETR